LGKIPKSIGPQTLLESFYFLDPWKPRKSFPNFCAPKFTQVPILAFPNSVQFSGNFSQIFLPPESLYSISNPILIHKSIRIDFLLLYLISAREMVSA
jgi:hypothetical protein